MSTVADQCTVITRTAMVAPCLNTEHTGRSHRTVLIVLSSPTPEPHHCLPPPADSTRRTLS